VRFTATARASERLRVGSVHEAILAHEFGFGKACAETDRMAHAYLFRYADQRAKAWSQRSRDSFSANQIFEVKDYDQLAKSGVRTSSQPIDFR
jgi:hypothetical protein